MRVEDSFLLGEQFGNNDPSSSYHCSERGRRRPQTSGERPSRRRHVHPAELRVRGLRIGRHARHAGRRRVLHVRVRHAGRRHSVGVHFLERLEHVDGGRMESGVLLPRLGRQLPVARLDAVLLHCDWSLGLKVITVNEDRVSTPCKL